MRHIFTPDDQQTKNYSSHANNLLNLIISIPFMFQQKRTRWIVATIDPIPCRPCVHPSTFLKALIDKFCSSKRREIIIFAHNLFDKTQTNQATCCLDFQSSIFFHSLGLDTLFQLQSILTLIV